MERFAINTHRCKTYQILHRIPGFDDIAAWASYHHEEPDGSGYPFHLRSDDLPLPARIMRVADIFQAMVQNRPYRRGLKRDQVRTFMRDLAADNRIDCGGASILDANLDEAMTAARDAA